LHRGRKNRILLSDVLIKKEKWKSVHISYCELIAVASSGVILHLHNTEDRKGLKITVVRGKNFCLLKIMEIGKVVMVTCPQFIASLLVTRSQRRNK